MHKILSARTFWLIAGYFLFLIWFSTLYSSQMPENIENLIESQFEDQNHIPSKVRFNDIKAGTLLQKTGEPGIFTNGIITKKNLLYHGRYVCEWFHWCTGSCPTMVPIP